MIDTLTKPAALATPEDVRRLLRWSRLVALDLETSGLNPRTDRIRLISLSDGNRSLVLDCWEHDVRQFLPELSSKILIAHNATFDLSFLVHAGMQPIPETICTYLLGKVITCGEGNHGFAPMGLGPAVFRWLDKDIKKDLQRSDWSGPLSAEQIEYSRQDAAVLLPLFRAQAADLAKYGLEKVADIELRALPAFVWLRMNGAAFDESTWKALARSAAVEQRTLDAKLAEFAPQKGATGLFGATDKWNWNSPDQVKDVLHKLGLKPQLEYKGETYESTADSVLATIDHPFVTLLRKYREVSQLVKMYGENWLESADIQNGRIYADWHQLGAASGRTACSSPNLQQVPRDKRYRRCLVAPTGKVLIRADYSQLQLRIAAKWSGDKTMMKVYQSNGDIHTETAKALTGKSEPSKGDRQIAKSANFGLLFGMTAEGLKVYSKTTYGVDMTVEEAKEHRSKFFSTYWGLARWHSTTKEKHVKETRTAAGRRRLLPSNAPDTWRLNSPVQGDEADLLKTALALLWERRSECPDAFPVLVVHDEIVVETVADKVRETELWLTKAMIDAGDGIMDPVPVTVETKVCQTWGD